MKKNYQTRVVSWLIALANYKKALQIDPNFENSKKAVAELEKDKK